MQVIVVPAEPTQPCTLLDIPDGEWHATRTRLVGDTTERAVYDRDAVLWVDGDGAAASPANPRATRYAFGHSAAGRQHHTDPDNPPYWLYGTVLVTGDDTGDEMPADAPARLHGLFDVEP